MAIEAIKELVTKFQSIQAQITKKQAELQKLRKAHLDFWEIFQQKCRETGHSLTQKEKDALLESAWKPSSRLTMFDMKIIELRTHGYICPYCLAREKGSIEKMWGTPLHKLDLCKKESFEKWFNCNKEKWPVETMELFEISKKEVTDYLAKAQPLEQELAELEKKQNEIYKQVQEIFDLCDDVLGITEALRKQLKNALSSGSTIPYDPDDPSGYWYWQAWH